MALPSPAASLEAHVRTLLASRSYPNVSEVADALGWDASGRDPHAQRTHRMVQAALDQVGVFGVQQGVSAWRLAPKKRGRVATETVASATELSPAPVDPAVDEAMDRLIEATGGTAQDFTLREPDARRGRGHWRVDCAWGPCCAPGASPLDAIRAMAVLLAGEIGDEDVATKLDVLAADLARAVAAAPAAMTVEQAMARLVEASGGEDFDLHEPDGIAWFDWRLVCHYGCKVNRATAFSAIRAMALSLADELHDEGPALEALAEELTELARVPGSD